MNNNELDGPIPAELGNLPDLLALRLTNNQLSGPIPQELANLSNLWGLYLDANQLTCWETEGVLAWALSRIEHYWDDPPGSTVCQP